MSVHVSMTVTVNNGGGVATKWQMEVEGSESGGNPIYTPSCIRAAIAKLAEQVDRGAVSQYGDIGEERAKSDYTRPIPTAEELTT